MINILGTNYTIKYKNENEEMIDWFAIQYPKIKEIYKKLKIED